MDRPYIICHMMASIDGRIDCAMTAKLPGVEDYYRSLEALNVPSTLSGRVTAELELTDAEAFISADSTPIGKENFFKAEDADGYSVVVDTKGSLGWNGNIVDDKPLIVIMSENAPGEYTRYLADQKISWIAVGKEHIDLVKACKILKEEFTIERMGIVGGGTINAGFLDAGLLDEVSVMYAPGIDGRGGMKAVFDSLPMEREPFRLNLKSVEQTGSGCVWIRYTI